MKVTRTRRNAVHRLGGSRTRSRGFDPATLNPSAWYSRRDISTLWQDSAGTLAVSAAGQPIGLELDKRTVPGPELWDDAAATFTGGASRVSSGVYRIFTSDGSLSAVNGSLLTIGKTYSVSYAIQSVAAANGGVSIDNNGANVAPNSVVGSYRATYKAAATAFRIKRVIASGVTDITVADISIRELPGNHQMQATTPARPLYQTGPARAEFDGLDDVLVTTFPTALGENCTVARAIPGVGAQILTGVNIGTTFNDNVTAVELLIFNRALTAGETALLTAYLNKVSQ